MYTKFLQKFKILDRSFEKRMQQPVRIPASVVEVNSQTKFLSEMNRFSMGFPYKAYSGSAMFRTSPWVDSTSSYSLASLFKLHFVLSSITSFRFENKSETSDSNTNQRKPGSFLW
mmetsp:Transcript_4382/g.6955  ORF Transcript_4382/g.6955 Transcript_4382/m.6955 type:complete len:115 (-) Transcript_4382:2075-2419(-)